MHWYNSNPSGKDSEDNKGYQALPATYIYLYPSKGSDIPSLESTISIYVCRGPTVAESPNHYGNC